MTSKGQNLVDMLLVSKLVSEADICPVSDKESACTHVQIARQNTMLTCGTTCHTVIKKEFWQIS